MNNKLLFPQKFPVKIIVEVQESEEKTLLQIKETLASLSVPYEEWSSKKKGKYTSFSSSITTDTREDYDAVQKGIALLPGLKFVL